jgi:sugar phosphate isomerase/epimerase
MKTCLALSPTKSEFAPLLYTGDLRLGMQKAAAFGFDGVELNLRNSDKVDQDTIVGWAEELGLEVPSFGTGQSYFADGLSLADTRPEIQVAVRERLKGHVRFAARVGARVVLGSIRGKFSDPDPAVRQAQYDVAVEATREVSAYAARHGVGLTVEAINRYETNFLNTAAETLAFIDDVGAPNVGLVLDTFHMNIEEVSLARAILEAGDRLHHVHLVDSNRLAPGEGHIDFASVIAALKQIGYTGHLSGEMLPLPDDDLASRSFIEYVSKLLET